MMFNHPRVTITLGTAALLTPALLQAADITYPQRAVTIIVPSSPGTGHDILARTLGRKLSDRWGTGVVIDNKTGASGAIGAQLLGPLVLVDIRVRPHVVEWARICVLEVIHREVVVVRKRCDRRAARAGARNRRAPQAAYRRNLD